MTVLREQYTAAGQALSKASKTGRALLRFEITVDNAKRVQVPQCERDLRRVESRLRLAEHILFRQSRKEITARHELQNQIQTPGRLKGCNSSLPPREVKAQRPTVV